MRTDFSSLIANCFAVESKTSFAVAVKVIAHIARVSSHKSQRLSDLRMGQIGTVAAQLRSVVKPESFLSRGGAHDAERYAVDGFRHNR